MPAGAMRRSSRSTPTSSNWASRSPTRSDVMTISSMRRPPSAPSACAAGTRASAIAAHAFISILMLFPTRVCSEFPSMHGRSLAGCASKRRFQASWERGQIRRSCAAMCWAHAGGLDGRWSEESRGASAARGPRPEARGPRPGARGPRHARGARRDASSQTAPSRVSLTPGVSAPGYGVITACLMLGALFAWGIYLDLTRVQCLTPDRWGRKSPRSRGHRRRERAGGEGCPARARARMVR